MPLAPPVTMMILSFLKPRSICYVVFEDIAVSRMLMTAIFRDRPFISRQMFIGLLLQLRRKQVCGEVLVTYRTAEAVDGGGAHRGAGREV